jgi:hypothetical protein
MSSTVDYIMKLVAFNGELWVFGQNAITVWYNNGSSTAPFSPRAGATIRPGLGSARTVVELDGSLWWLGVDNCVYRTVGYQAKRVSDHAIEELIADFNDGYLRTAVACGFVHEGHIFYALSLPEAGITLVYDTTTGVWHERSSAADAVGRWNINTATFLGSRGLYGSSRGRQAVRDGERHLHRGGRDRAAAGGAAAGGDARAAGHDVAAGG